MDSLPHNLASETDWVNYNDPHIQPAINWVFLQQNVQKDDIMPELLRLKAQSGECRSEATPSAAQLASSPEDDFNFEIEWNINTYQRGFESEAW